MQATDEPVIHPPDDRHAYIGSQWPRGWSYTVRPAIFDEGGHGYMFAFFGVLITNPVLLFFRRARKRTS